jgi:mannose-1-phosphate guanylyltransferase/mannose-6-phosphate isomerase
LRAFCIPDLFARPIVITNADFRFVVAEQLRERGVEADIVLEPMRRDSGLAVAVSALLAAERDRNALVLVLRSCVLAVPSRRCPAEDCW